MSMHRLTLPGLVLAGVGLLAGSAAASGLEIPDNGTRAISRGGAFSVLADDLSAIALNPGALSRQSGTQLFLANDFKHGAVTFTRAVSVIPATADYGFDPFAPVENDNPWFVLGPMAVVASDFGLEDWTFAAGVYGPSALGSSKYPIDGGQRYMMTQLDVRLVYLNAAAAWGKKDRFGVGVTLQYALGYELRMRLVVDGSLGGALSPYYDADDVHADINLSDNAAFSAIVGAWWRPVQWLELGVSGRVLPVYLNFTGDWSIDNVPGQTQFPENRLEVTNSSASLDMVLPPTARLGARYRHMRDGREVFDVELNLVYEAWSMMESYDVDLEGEINLFAPSAAPDAIIEKRWRDTLSVRLGGTWNVVPDVFDVSLGGLWEQGATPKNYEHIDFPSFDRWGLGFGLRGVIGPVTLGASYMHIFQEDRNVDERSAKVFQVRPLDECPEDCDGGAGWSGVPANAGTFETSYDTVSVSLGLAF